MSGFAKAHLHGMDRHNPVSMKAVRAPHSSFSDATMSKPKAASRPMRPPIIDKVQALKSDANAFRAIRGVPGP